MSVNLSNLEPRVVVTLAVMATAGFAWLVAIVASIASRAQQPKKGLRRTETLLIGASVLFLIATGFAMFILTSASKLEVTQKVVKPARAARGTCAALRVGMRADAVTKELGPPDEVRSEEDVRGPEAAAWIYVDSRCSVHILSGRVDFVD